MKIYIARCEGCEWTAEKNTRPDAWELGRIHETAGEEHETHVEVYRDE